MSYVLVKIEIDFADEFDIDGIIVEKKEIWEASQLGLKEQIEEHEPDIYFGTNEYISFNSFSQFERSCDVQEIPDDEALILIKHLKGYYKDCVYFGLGAEVISRLFEKISDYKE